MKTERMTFVMSPEDKAEITDRAARLHIPASELIRRAVARYEPDDDESVLLRVAEELEESVKQTDQKLDEAIAAVNDAVTQIRQHRAEQSQ